MIIVLLVANWILSLALALAIFGLYRVHGQMLLNTRQNHSNRGPKVGKVVRQQRLRSVDGSHVTMGSPRERPQLIFFAQPHCAGCQKAKEPLCAFARANEGSVDIVVVYRGTDEEVREFTRALPDAVMVVVDMMWSIGTTWRVAHTPFAVLIDEAGIVRGKGMPSSRTGFDWFMSVLRSGVTNSPEEEQYA